MIRRILLSLPLLGVLCGTAFSTASAVTITVTTNVDEDGENSSACSLREAIKASETKTAYGGCPAGQQYYTDLIQLAAGNYQLTRGELVVSGAMVFNGAYAQSLYLSDPITGQFPRRTPVTTTILAQSGNRIFNTSTTRNDLNINAINLSGGHADLGGAILAGGTIELNRVNISGATADQQGGAIYLEGDLATVSATASTFTQNTAPRGAVLGMSCYDNLKYTTRAVTLSQLSITNNGSATSSSILDFCGQPTVTLGSSTIAQNTTLTNGGDAVGNAATIRMIDNNTITRLSKASTLSVVSNTITENTTAYGLLYGNIATLALTSNFLAYNQGGLDCHYQLDGGVDTDGNPLVSVAATFNLFASTLNPGTQTTSKCVFYQPTSTSVDNNVYANSSEGLSDFLNPLGYYGATDVNYYGYLPISGKGLISKGAPTSICGATDQRGLPRGSGTQLVITADGTSTINIPCDIGSMDVSELTANDDQGFSNTSYILQTNIFTDTTGLTPADAKLLTDYNTAYVAAYKSSFRYREAVLDVLKNDFASEVVSGNSSTIPLLAPGAGIASLYTITGSDSGNIHCEWNDTMKQLLATRKDGTISPGGQLDRCQYTITPKADPSKAVTGSVSFTITNLPPIAIDHQYSLTFGASSIPMDLLEGASDDGDGPTTSSGYPAGKLQFYQDTRIVNGKTVIIPANIILTTKPTQGHIVAEFEEPCITNTVNSAQNTCYGGKLTYVNDNLFSPFNDSFTYGVIDSDFAPSNTATVTITNTATTTDQEKSGGGSLGLGALFGLSCLAFMRRRAVMSQTS